MPYTPLVPLPGGGETVGDPFEELLRPNPAPQPSSSTSSARPLFSPTSHSSAARPAAHPIVIPRHEANGAASSNSHANGDTDSGAAAPLATPSSSTSDFGDFVSVDPSQDPLGSGFSPSDQSMLPSSGASDAFVDEARQRAEEGEKRIMDEFDFFENDPSSLLKGDQPSSSIAADLQDALSTPGHVPTPPGATLLDSEPEELLNFDSSFSPHTPIPYQRQPPMSIYSGLSPNLTPSQSALGSRSGTPTNMHYSTRAPEPIPSSSHEKSSLDEPDGSSTLDREDDPSPMSSSFTSYFSGTLSRKWSNMLRSSSSNNSSSSSLSAANGSPSFMHATPSPPHPTHAVSMPATLSTLTHDSPFADHVFIPPSGAPGFAGERNWNKGFEFSPAQKVGNPVELVGRNDTAQQVLTSEIAQAIRPHLPAFFRLTKQWSLLYSLDQHGISLATFYARVSPHCGLGGCLLVIRDSEDHTFGVWVGDGIRRSASIGSSRGYYGSGDSFLWKEEHHQNRQDVKVYKWTGKNDYVALCEADYISFGGGDGRYGLFLDSSLFDGSTAPCPTFGNAPLCGSPDASGTVRFECVGLEAWGILR
ncbi:TLD-domain-containing protein [Clavulina sp. PMI_390]|nr:TLD-domain-containing protein [Clavulina sp. PMI_390]